MAKEEFARAGVIQPRDIPAMEELVTRYWLTQAISPPVFFKPKALTYTPEVQQKMKEREQKALEISLDLLGC